MADPRNFNSPNDERASQNGMFLYGDKSETTVGLTQELGSEVLPGSAPLYSEKLSDFHVSESGESNSKPKIIAGAIVALMLGAAAVYAFTASDQPMRVANENAAPVENTMPTTPQAAEDDAIFTPSDAPASPDPVSAPAIESPEPVRESRNIVPATPRMTRTARAAIPAAPTATSETGARANATTEAINQSMAENAARRPLPATTAPDSVSTVEPTAPMTAPTVPSAEPAPATTPQAEPVPVAPVQ